MTLRRVTNAMSWTYGESEYVTDPLNSKTKVFSLLDRAYENPDESNVYGCKMGMQVSETLFLRPGNFNLVLSEKVDNQFNTVFTLEPDLEPGYSTTFFEFTDSIIKWAEDVYAIIHPTYNAKLKEDPERDDGDAAAISFIAVDQVNKTLSLLSYIILRPCGAKYNSYSTNLDLKQLSDNRLLVVADYDLPLSRNTEAIILSVDPSNYSLSILDRKDLLPLVQVDGYSLAICCPTGTELVEITTDKFAVLIAGLLYRDEEDSYTYYGGLVVVTLDTTSDMLTILDRNEDMSFEGGIYTSHASGFVQDNLLFVHTSFDSEWDMYEYDGLHMILYDLSDPNAILLLDDYQEHPMDDDKYTSSYRSDDCLFEAISFIVSMPPYIHIIYQTEARSFRGPRLLQDTIEITGNQINFIGRRALYTGDCYWPIFFRQPDVVDWGSSDERFALFAMTNFDRVTPSVSCYTMEFYRVISYNNNESIAAILTDLESFGVAVVQPEDTTSNTYNLGVDGR